MRKKLLIVIDGCSEKYLSEQHTPNIMEIAKDGFYTTTHGSIPSVTNVNHATIMTGEHPNVHGMTGNYYYHRDTGEHGFIEDSHPLKTETIFDRYHKSGKSTALLAVKGKVIDVFGRNVRYRINAQRPDSNLLAQLDLKQPPNIDTLEANDWIFEACHGIIAKKDPDLVYCTTNDYMMHNFSPESGEARHYMGIIDDWIGKIYHLDKSREIYITADHGMNPKTTLINMQNILSEMGYEVFCLLPLKDRYLENHIYQEGGAVYLYVLGDQQDLVDCLKAKPYVDGIYSKEEAGAKFHLPVNSIGDLLVLAAPQYAFGEFEGSKMSVNSVRTHGSLYEAQIPLISVNSPKGANQYEHSRDIVRFMK